MTNFNFLKSTLYFSIAGFFIPGFTAFAIVGLLLLLKKIGLGCIFAWTSINIATTLLSLILPFLFYRHLTFLNKTGIGLKKRTFILFNLFEYILIQSSLTRLFTDAQTSCYVSDGQNGLDLIFTAWLAIPILIAISIFFNMTISIKNA